MHRQMTMEYKQCQNSYLYLGHSRPRSVSNIIFFGVFTPDLFSDLAVLVWFCTDILYATDVNIL